MCGKIGAESVNDIRALLEHAGEKDAETRDIKAVIENISSFQRSTDGILKKIDVVRGKLGGWTDLLPEKEIVAQILAWVVESDPQRKSDGRTYYF